ncbi:MAG: chromate transporter [Bacteroidales bacterium]|nr:chromate transporter [Bacteroidales bacterium]
MISLWKIFFVFAKVGAFTIGGGYAMVPIIREELCSRGWIDSKEFPDILAIAQSAPGLLAVNTSIFAGYRLRGWAGAAAATIGSCAAPFLMILAIAMFFSGYSDNEIVIKIFKGIRPAVVALIAVPMIKMARECNHKWHDWLLTIAALLLVVFLKVSPIYILLVTIILFLSYYLYKERKG